MRVTIVNRYFWPESVLVNDIARWLAEAGHDVEVLTGQPDYNPEIDFSDHCGDENWNGVRIRRIVRSRSKDRGLLRNIISLWFVLKSMLILLFGRKRDVVWLTSIPPVVQPFLIRIATALRRTKLIYFPQDIYPEIAISSDLMGEGFLPRVLKAIDSWVIRHADEVVTISHDMADHLFERASLTNKPVVIRSFSPVDERRPDISERKTSFPLRFVFAGNIGRFQNLDALVDAFSEVDPELAVLELLGNGREKARLEEIVRERAIANVRFHDFLPVEEAARFVAACDVGVVSLRPGIHRFAFPAKTYTYIGAGLPLLTFVEDESELARLVRERGLGVNIAWSQPKSAIAKGIQEMVSGYPMFLNNVYAHTDDLYLPHRARKQWIGVFEDICTTVEKGRHADA